MLMVSLLHVLGRGGALEETDPLRHGVFLLLEVAAFCAVDGYALISGYLSERKTHKLSRVIGMWLQVEFYSLVLSLILIPAGLGEINGLKGLAQLALPLTMNTYWYFTAYFFVFMMAPYVNTALDALRDNQLKALLLLSVVLLSLMGTLNDPFQSNSGYSVIWLLCLFVIGGILRRTGLGKNIKTKYLVLTIALSVAATWGIAMCGIGRIMSYLSPGILLNAVLLLILFSRLNIKSRFVAGVSRLTFGVYLFQMNPIIWPLLNKFEFYNNYPLAAALLIIAVLTVGLFASGAAVEWIRQKLFKLFRVRKLCDILDNLINRLIKKLFKFDLN